MPLNKSMNKSVVECCIITAIKRTNMLHTTSWVNLVDVLSKKKNPDRLHTMTSFICMKFRDR